MNSRIFAKLAGGEVPWMVLVLCAALAPRIYVFTMHQVVDYDGTYYAQLGKNLVSGAGYTEPEGVFNYYYPPLYPANIGVFSKVFGDLGLASKMVSLVYGSALVLLLYWIARLVHGRTAAIVAGLLAAFHPGLIRFSSTDTAESLFLFILLLIAGLALRAAPRPNAWQFAVIGVLFGLLYLTKPAGIQYLAGFMVALCGAGVLLRWKYAALTVRALAVVGAFIVVALPYMLFLKGHYGHWTVSELTTPNIVRSNLVFSGDNQEKVYELSDDGKELRYFTSPGYPGERVSAAAMFRKAPLWFVRRYVFNLRAEIRYLFEGLKWLWPVIVALAGFHVFSAEGLRRDAARELFMISILLPLFSAPLISTSSDRWVLPMVCVLIVWCANGVVLAVKGISDRARLPNRWLAHGLTAAPILVWLVLGTVPAMRSVSRWSYLYPHEHKEMGVWMKQFLHISDSTVIMSASPHVSFYAGAGYKTMPWSSLDGILRYAAYHNVEYLVADDHFLGNARKQKAVIEGMSRQTTLLEPVKTIRHPNGRSISLYRLKE